MKSLSRAQLGVLFVIAGISTATAAPVAPVSTMTVAFSTSTSKQPAANPDFQRLLHFVEPLAKSSLQKYEGFYPFAATMNQVGEIAVIPAFSPRETPDPRDVHELNVKALRRIHSDGNLRAAALCSDITTMRAGTNEEISEIQIRLESQGGESFMMHIPYTKLPVVGFKFLKETYVPEASIIFHEPPAPVVKPSPAKSRTSPLKKKR